MTENKYAPSAWGAAKLADLEVPSGQLCQVRMPGIQQLIGAGILDSADTLTSLIDEKHIKRVQGKGKAQSKASVKDNELTLPDGAKATVNTDSLLKDPEKLNRVFGLIDRVIEHMVVQPAVIRPIRRDDSGKEIDLTMGERADGQIYTDMVDLQDKMFIFQYAVGGDSDLESFRNRFGTGVASVAAE